MNHPGWTRPGRRNCRTVYTLGLFSFALDNHTPLDFSPFPGPLFATAPVFFVRSFPLMCGLFSYQPFSHFIRFIKHRMSQNAAKLCVHNACISATVDIPPPERKEARKKEEECKLGVQDARGVVYWCRYKGREKLHPCFSSACLFAFTLL